MPKPLSNEHRRLTIRLLGPVDVEIDGQPLAVDTRKAVALLAYVSLADGAVPREALAALLWPESGEAEARSALRRTLSVLNGGLLRTGIVVDRRTVGIDRDVTELDVETFRASVDQARAHRHVAGRACPECLDSLRSAFDVARGPFMDGFAIRDSEPFDEWLAAERSSYERELAGALERLVREQIAVGDWRGAIRSAQRWSQLDQLHEPAHRALMEAYARSGERAAAIKQYRDAAAVLERELGVSPLPETLELYEAIVSDTLAEHDGATASIDEPGQIDDRATPVPLIGRDAELDRAIRLLGPRTAGGRVLVIEGEAGIGKSRLADAVAEEVRRSGRSVAAARCYPGETGIAFAPVVALLRSRLQQHRVVVDALPGHTRAALASLIPDMPAVTEVGAKPRRSRPTARLALLESIADVMAGGGAHSDEQDLVRIEDMQWADDSTVEFLAFLLRRLDRYRLPLLLTWRREELDRRSEPLIAELSASDIIRLERLAPDDARALIAALPGSSAAAMGLDETDTLIDEAEGLPLYMVEAVRSPERPIGAVPAGIRALLQSRLAALSDLAAQVVVAAAVIGRSFDLDTLRHVSGRSDDETVGAIEEMTARGIVTDAVATELADYDFAHARLRDVAYEDASAARRRLLHRRAAEAYRGRTASQGDQLGRLARIARHEREGGRTQEAADAFLAAGFLARDVFANSEAVAYLGSALALGHADSSHIHLAIAEVRTRIGDYGGAIAALEVAAAAAGPLELATIEQHVGRINLRRGDAQAAERHLVASLEALASEGAEVDARRSQIQADRAISTARLGDMEAAASLAATARSLAGDDDAACVTADRIVGLVERERGDLEAAERALAQSLAVAERIDDPVAIISARNGLGLLAADAGDTMLATEQWEEALTLARRTGERHLEAAIENNLADTFEASGDRDAAMTHLKAAAVAFADVEGPTEDRQPGIWMLESW